MKKVDIQFGGMSIAPDDQVARDGDMAMLMNARIKNGEIMPMNKDAVFDIPNEKKVIQSQFHGDRLLELYEDGTLKVSKTYDSTEYDETLSRTFAGIKAESFAISGNVVIINSENRVEYAIWRNRVYEYIGELPTFSLNLKFKEYNIEYNSENEFTTNDRQASDYYKSITNGFVDEALDFVYNQKGFIDRTIIEFGLRMFDGSYIPVGYTDFDISPINRECIEIEPIVNTNGVIYDKAKINTKISYFTIDFPDKIPIGPEWKDIILGVDCFCCGSIMNITEITHNYTDAAFDIQTLRIYGQKNNDELEKSIIDAEYFRVATLGFNGTDIWMTKTSPSAMAQLDRRKDVVLTQNVSDYHFCYNSRIHSVKKQKLFDGYTINNGTPFKKTECYTIFDTEMTKLTKKSFTGSLGNILMYPSEEAYSMYITTEKQKGIFILDKKRMGKSFYFDMGDEDLYIIRDNQYTPINIPGLYPSSYNIKAVFKNETYGLYIEIRRKYNGKLFVGGYWTKEVCPTLRNYMELGDEIDVNIDYRGVSRLKTISLSNSDVIESYEAKNNIVEENNVLNVSALDNPFYYPESQEYQFDGNVIKVVSNAEAVSQGQFGQYPLYVFTTEGIWAMQVDTTGKTAYAAQVPISREVCNGDAVATTNGIAFTTKRGVMMINGAQVTEISQGLDGLQVALFRHSGELMLDIVNRYRNEDEKFEGNIKPVPIREFIDGAKLGWFYSEGELLVYNPKFLYSYVYNVKSQTWYMVDRNYVMRAENLGPQSELLLYRDDKKRYVFGMDDKRSTFVAITRPIKTNTLDYKRLRQAALRCTCKSLGRLGFYVLASNNGGDFVCITGKEAPNSELQLLLDHRDLVTAMSRSKQYKYFAIAIAGDMTGSVSFAELLIDEGFANNKLR